MMRREARQPVLEDGATQIDIGGRDIGDQAHAEARQEPLLDSVERLRRAVGGEDQPLALGEQRVDRVKQLFLRRRLALMMTGYVGTSAVEPRTAT